MVEWTGNQQLLFLLQSVCLGFPVGLLFDLNSVLNSARGRIWKDALFGVEAALVVFFGALAIMDGQLHPLLFFGSFCGTVLEHYTTGFLLVRIVIGIRKECRRFRKLIEKMLAKTLEMLARLCK